MHFTMPATEAEKAVTEFLNGLGDEIKGVAETVERLTERVAALEQAKEPSLPQKYGLWNILGEGWYSKSPFDSAGEATDYAINWFHADWRNQWRVYPYPEDGGKPMELREPEAPKLPELWGVWLENKHRWFDGSSSDWDGGILFFKSVEKARSCAIFVKGEARILPIEELIRD